MMIFNKWRKWKTWYKWRIEMGFCKLTLSLSLSLFEVKMEMGFSFCRERERYLWVCMVRFRFHRGWRWWCKKAEQKEGKVRESIDLRSFGHFNLQIDCLSVSFFYWINHFYCFFFICCSCDDILLESKYSRLFSNLKPRMKLEISAWKGSGTRRQK